MNAYELEIIQATLHSQGELIKQQADRIAELEKTMGERLNNLNTRQVEDERTSLVSTPPYAYAVVQGEDDRENVSLQFNHPEMCGQKYNQAIPLFTTPQNQLEKKSKPVAWMSPDGKVSQTEGNLFYIPLYTTPQTKPLSDEEIWNWFKENTALTKESALRIARAIEERHGIK